ncbi:Thioredoxin-like protein [Tolypocladium paradoxum]|uniref:Thioredoxin-like protein n=1 Tax=Tolypocladium paradoxum TaxID=94208 RepID=A0A2S4KLB6_9HYPO|nr:Thioredoxin-like protein [Tolypocladium paradoxum]
MSGLISIGSTAEWQSLLSGTNVVVADFYADWCGPCKMIAPHFERLAKEHSRPKKVAFAKVNVDTQSTVARSNGVSAMPTFKIFHGGNCIDTIKGANPSALSEAVSKALKLADVAGKPGEAFKTPGRTLGGEAPSAGGASGGGGGWNLNMGSILNALIVLVGLYLVSLFSARSSQKED